MDDLLSYRQDIEKLLLSTIYDFSTSNVTILLVMLGLLPENQRCTEEELERIVFLYGDDKEIYVKEEREFIEKIGSIYIYPNYYKKTKKGNISCRVIAVNMNVKGSEITNCISFMKIVNKALNGFNIFCMKMQNKIYLGCRLYDKDINRDCTLSHPIFSEKGFEKIAEQLLFIPFEDDFISYYTYLVDTINTRENCAEDYEDRIIKRKGIQFSYLKLLEEIGNFYDIDLIFEKERYINSFVDEYKIDFRLLLEDALAETNFIKSCKVNTLEMLFEAEEMAQLANKTENENERISINHSIDERANYEEVENFKEYLDDPELMIKILKQKRGL